LFLMLMPLPVRGSDAKGHYVALGFGLESCQTFLQAKSNRLDLPYRHWLTGYLTAVNKLTKDTVDIRGTTNIDGMLWSLEHYCIKHRQAEGDQALGQSQGAARPGGHHRGQTLGEDAAAAAAIGAKPLADAQLQPHTVLRPGQVGEGACVVTMDAPRWRGAERTGRADLGRLHGEGDLRRGVVDLAGFEMQQGRIG